MFDVDVGAGVVDVDVGVVDVGWRRCQQMPSTCRIWNGSFVSLVSVWGFGFKAKPPKRSDVFSGFVFCFTPECRIKLMFRQGSRNFIRSRSP